MTATTTRKRKPAAKAKPVEIDQRAEIRANEIIVVVTMPSGQGHQLKIDASKFDTSEKVGDEVRAILLRLLTS